MTTKTMLGGVVSALLIAVLGTGVYARDIPPTLTSVVQELTGPVAVDFMTTSTVVVSERTSVSLMDLESKEKTLLIGSLSSGGYVDGGGEDARFSLINDVVVHGNYIYLADYSCVRMYNIERKLVATLAGVCGRMDEGEVDQVAAPVFKGHLKLAVSARDLYVLDGETVSRVDKETGVVWTLSVGELLSEGSPTSIEMDRFTNTLFVAVVTEEKVKVISIDAVSGRQSLYTTLTRARRGGNGMTAMIASLDISPDGTMYVLETTRLHSIDSKRRVSTRELNGFGFHRLTTSSQALVLSQEYYSHMYSLQLMNVGKGKEMNEEGMRVMPERVSATRRDKHPDGDCVSEVNLFQTKAFYVAIVFPSALILLLIFVVICASHRIIKSQSRKRNTRPESDNSSEKFILPGGADAPNSLEGTYWM